MIKIRNLNVVFFYISYKIFDFHLTCFTSPIFCLYTRWRLSLDKIKQWRLLNELSQNFDKRKAWVIACIYTSLNSPITHSKVNDLSLFFFRLLFFCCLVVIIIIITSTYTHRLWSIFFSRVLQSSYTYLTNISFTVQ